jgi:ribosomal protein S21
MSINVEVSEGESFEDALKRFNQLVRLEQSRPWHKRRYGYYEKPSELKRKRKKMRWLRSTSRGNLQLHIGLKELYSRTGAKNSAGR